MAPGLISPRKRFYFVANENCNCSECPYMKLNTLEKLRDCLLHLEPRVELTSEIMERALRPRRESVRRLSGHAGGTPG